MKKTIITLVALFSVFSVCQAQEIEMEKVFGGYVYRQNGQVQTLKNLLETLESNQEAYNLMKKARSTGTTAMVLGSIGGFLFGYPIGTAIGGGEPAWEVLGVGAGFLAIAFPLSASSNKKAKQAVELYNAGLGDVGYKVEKPQLSLFANATELGLKLRF
jgi:hypothetical protein